MQKPEGERLRDERSYYLFWDTAVSFVVVKVVEFVELVVDSAVLTAVAFGDGRLREKQCVSRIFK